MSQPKTISIDNIEYVRADSVSGEKYAEDTDGKQYCIIRTYSAGVFAGYVEKREGKEVTLLNSRRLWRWYGATLSQVSMEGLLKYSECKVPMMEKRKILPDSIEITPCTEKARKSIEGCPVWKM